MKKLLFQMIACAAVLLPLGTLQAKTYGDFKPGQTFTFTVTDANSSKANLSGSVSCPVPKGLPKFKVGDTVKFTIGKKGELKGPGFSIKFVPDSSSVSSNAYVNKSNGSSIPFQGTVHKNTSTKQAAAVDVHFYKMTGSGFGSTTYMVNYVMQ